MQTRMALIIGASDQSIPGVSIDVDRMHSFLLSPIGGFWKENEVDRLISPSKENLQKKIHDLKYFDYAIIYFAGHGYYSSGSNQTIVQINDKEKFKTHDFRNGAKKQTIILDCCRRSINDRNLLKSIIKEAAFDSANNIKIDPDLCRFFSIRKLNIATMVLT